MSVHVLSWVLRHSPATLGRRLVLIVLADKANDDGTGAWPSINTIAHEARLSRRATIYALQRLEEDEQIVRDGVSRYGTVNYSVVMDPEFSAEPPYLTQPSNSNSSLDDEKDGSMDGLGAIHDTLDVADCTGADFAPPWEWPF